MLKYRITADIEGLGISVVDHVPQELMYFSFEGLHADFSLSSIDSKAEIVLRALQVNLKLFIL